MRSIVVFFILLGGCTSGHMPVVFPFAVPVTGEAPRGEDQRRAAVEVIVKTRFAEILADIQSGGGPVLTEAFDAAGVPDGERATRAFQLNNDLGLYVESPGALATAISLYGA